MACKISCSSGIALAMRQDKQSPMRGRCVSFLCYLYLT